MKVITAVTKLTVIHTLIFKDTRNLAWFVMRYIYVIFTIYYSPK